jgi:uncharacterized protein (DUF1697 family)
MAVFISLLRGINVGGQKKVKMADLKAVYEALHLETVTTYVQSGNVVFEGSNAEPSALSQRISEGIEKAFGFSTEIITRSVDDWRELIEHNPFGKDSEKDPKYLHATLLAEIPDEQLAQNTSTIKFEPDEFVIQGNVVYLYCPDGYGRSKLTNTFWEKKLKVAATTRNWNTVNKLLELAEAIQES